MKKVENKFYLLVIIMVCFSIHSFVLGNESRKLNVLLKYSENMKVDGYETQLLSYDFNKDGIDEKLMVNIQDNEGVLKIIVSIYTLQNNEYILSYQIPFEKKVHLLNINYGKNQIEKIKEYYSDYSKNLKEGEIRYITILDNNTTEKIYFDLQFDKYSPKDLDNFLFTKKTSEFKESPDSNTKTVFKTKYKEKPKALAEVLAQFEVIHREDMQEDFERTKINAEIVVIKKA